MEQEAKKASPLEQQGRGISPMQSAQPTKTPSASEKTAFFQAPSAEEMSDDSGLLEEESFNPSAAAPSKGAGEKPPIATPKQTPPTTQTTPPSKAHPEVKPAAPQEKKPMAVGPPETGQAPGSKQPAAQKPGIAPIGPPQQQKTQLPPEVDETKTVAPKQELRGAPLTGKKGPPQRSTPQSGLTAADLETTGAPKEEDTSGFFEQMSGIAEEKQTPPIAKPIEKKQEEAALQGVGTPPPPSESMQIAEEEGVIQAEEKEKTPSQQIASLPSEQGQAQPMIPLPPGPETLPPYANMHPEVQELFDRMVGVMTVMNSPG